MGVRIFEKHFKLDGQKGLDSKFSSSSLDFKNYVKNINISFLGAWVKKILIEIFFGEIK